VNLNRTFALGPVLYDLRGEKLKEKIGTIDLSDGILEISDYTAGLATISLDVALGSYDLYINRAESLVELRYTRLDERKQPKFKKFWSPLLVKSKLLFIGSRMPFANDVDEFTLNMNLKNNEFTFDTELIKKENSFVLKLEKPVVRIYLSLENRPLIIKFFYKK
jgi:hypothetical protein